MSSMYSIERCRNCPNSIIDLDAVEKLVKEVFESTAFNQKQKTRLQTDRPMHHQIFRVAIAGCPNSCSQPQIKDFGIQGQLVPSLAEGCILCGECARSCPDQAIELNESGPEINRGLCLNCGVCVRKCPVGALRGQKSGYRLLAGGKLGRRPRLATVGIELANEDRLKKYLSETLSLLINRGNPGERLGQLLARI